MLTSHFASFAIDSIYVVRDERQRKELKDIDKLAASIARIGLIHPPVIHRDGKLRTGERRWTACKQLGWTHMPVQFVEDMNEAELQLLELAENVERANLTWQEECDAIAKYHHLAKSLDPSWNNARTAEALGISQSTVTEKLKVAEAIEEGNTTVVDAAKFSVAKGIVNRANERKTTSAIGKIFPIIAEQRAARIPPIYHANFLEWLESDPGFEFNFLHCDFPYGVDAGKHDQGAGASMGSYDDSFRVYDKLLDGLAVFTNSKSMAASAHLMFWFSMDYYQHTYDRLTAMGWKVDKFPLMWYKSDNTGILPDPSRGPRRIYETCFMASRGDRKIVRAVANVVAAPATKVIHMSEKNLAMLTKFMEMFVDENTVGLDPTCGSGNAVKAMAARGASHAIGLEINGEFAKLAQDAFYREAE